MLTETASWEQRDFLALFLIYAANADLEITEAERAYIVQRVERAHYEKAIGLFERQSDYEVLQTILAMKERFFPGEAGKETLEAFLIELFKVDHEYSYLEKNILRAIDRLL